MVDASTRKTLSGIPLLQTKAGPRDKELWVQRLKEEYQSLIKVRSSIWICPSAILLSFFFFIFCFRSMCRITRMRIRTGSVSNQIKKAQSGSAHAGTCIICWNTSSKLNLRYASAMLCRTTMRQFQFQQIHSPSPTDSDHISSYSTRDCATRAGRQNGKDVSWR